MDNNLININNLNYQMFPGMKYINFNLNNNLQNNPFLPMRNNSNNYLHNSFNLMMNNDNKEMDFLNPRAAGNLHNSFNMKNHSQ